MEFTQPFEEAIVVGQVSKVTWIVYFSLILVLGFSLTLELTEGRVEGEQYDILKKLKTE